MTVNQSDGVVRDQNQRIAALLCSFSESTKKFTLDVGKVSIEVEKANLLKLHKTGSEYFRLVESCVSDSEQTEGAEFDDWLRDVTKSALSVLSAIPTYIEHLRKHRERLGFPATSFEPSPGVFANMQGLLMGQRPTDAQEIKKRFLEMNLPTDGFSHPFFPSPINSKKVVMVVHGIRDRGVWQKKLAPLCAERNLIPELVDYGWFSVIPFLIPNLRRKKVDWFREEYNKVQRRYPGITPSVVAHSFGTYLVCRGMQIYAPLIKFDQVILCGSIVGRNFPWPNFFQRLLVKRVLNDSGKLDFWAGNVQKFVADAGSSGRDGFSATNDCLIEQTHSEWRHGDFFFEANFTERWIPFLKGENINEQREGDNLVSAPGNPWVLRLVVLALAALVVTTTLLLIWGKVTSSGAHSPSPEENYQPVYTPLPRYPEPSEDKEPAMR